MELTHKAPLEADDLMDPLILVAVIFGLAAVGYYFLESQGSVINLTQTTPNPGNLNASQIAEFAQNAGFEGDDLAIAVAIALAESSGDPNALGDSGTSIGLWQIHFTVHPEFDQASLYDPQYNANAAFAIYSNRGGTFQDWSTYGNAAGHNNAYLKYMDAAVSAVSV